MTFGKSLAVALLVAVAVPVSGAVIELRSDFSTGLDGWARATGSGTGPITLSYSPTGGKDPKAGYLIVKDGGSGASTLLAPQRFVDELNKVEISNGGTLSFDYRVQDFGGGIERGMDLKVELWIPTGLGLGQKLVYTFGKVDNWSNTSPWLEWQTFDIPLTADAWNISNEMLWQAVLESVTQIRLVVEATVNKAGYRMDTVNVGGIYYVQGPGVEVEGPTTPEIITPEPATLSLLGAAVLALWRRRR